MDPCSSHSPQSFQFFQEPYVEQGVPLLSPGAAAAVPHASDMLAYHLAVLRDKVQQLEPLVGMAISPPNGRFEATAMVAQRACSVLQEIATAATTVAHRLPLHRGRATVSNEQMFAAPHEAQVSLFGPADDLQWSHGQQLVGASTTAAAASTEIAGGDAGDVVELDASYLLARYTHYCQVCGKGFKRDANLRMHTCARTATSTRLRRYSCPAEGCRWNRRHPRFQPLKSVVCAKNHYRRSHCPKVYACRRCGGGKQFAVLSDLRTHEKHCGELRWRCSCGTSFSRKDKLMGHVALFAAGHAPIPVPPAAAAPRERS
ncbi:unnamed protein product [Urochloa decumbens]|uniref:C2H2-type domain-containing protein n=1 Tax=Urochloa decumbens TaxID=240449 RepID=A0ABC9D8U3_9POAL